MLRATFRREGAAAIAAGNGDVVARRGKAKIARLDLLFDVLGFLQLLARTTASSLTANPLSSRASFPVVPNILGLVLSEGEWSGNIKGSPLPHDTPMSPPATSGPATQPRVITQAEPPFRITHVNTAWCTLCGSRPDEAVGQTLAMVRARSVGRTGGLFSEWPLLISFLSLLATRLIYSFILDSRPDDRY